MTAAPVPQIEEFVRAERRGQRIGRRRRQDQEEGRQLNQSAATDHGINQARQEGQTAKVNRFHESMP